LGCYGIDESSTCGESSQVTPTHGKARTKLNETTKVKKMLKTCRYFSFLRPQLLLRDRPRRCKASAHLSKR
jgi:hypothetical protein